MKSKITMMFILGILITFVFLSHVYSQDVFKLRPGGKGKVCLNCHETLKETMKNPFVHTPVKDGNCSECHNPHASSHGNLLETTSEKICFGCHDDLIPKETASTHVVVVEGNCTKCHDPHASKYKNNLTKSGKDLCFECHKKMGDSVTNAKFKHKPVQQDCLKCHNPHASRKYTSLLTNDVSSLCRGCHNTKRPQFVKRHMNYPIGSANCTSCHNPHGSNVVGMLYDNVHDPVANRMCKQCHEAPESENPFRTKKEGFDLCRGCHYELVNETFSKNRLHWPIVSKEGCISCHSPHASKHGKLLSESTSALCGTCHEDTMQKQKISPTKHEPVAAGECTKCHAPHAADNLFLMAQTSVIALCGSCHDWEKHSTHPIGEKVIDKRNNNLSVECLSCHNSHGTENKHMMYFATITDTCIQCHVDLKR